jgi:hypothetical protein
MFVTVLLAIQFFLFQDASADRLIRGAMHANYELRFDESRKLTQTLQQTYPDHPAGYLLAAESGWWEAQADPKNHAVEQAYYAAQKAAAEHGIEALKHDKYARIELLSYLASSYGSLARFQLTNKSANFSALRAGMKALNYARQVHEMDPQYNDVYTGLGAYNYFTATLPAVIKPFAFLIGARGDKELGFAQLRDAMEKSRYSRTEAKIVYYSVLLEEKRYADALHLLEELMSEFSDNFVFYKWVSSLFETQHKLDDGIQYLDSLADRQLQRSPSLATHALINKASLEHTAGHDAQAKRTLEKIKSTPGTDRLVQSQATALEKTLK